MSKTDQSPLSHILKLHREVQTYTLLSVPGAFGVLTTTGLEVLGGGKLIRELSEHHPIPDSQAQTLLVFGVCLMAWWLAFERAEYCLINMKQQIRATFDGKSPIVYTPIDRFVNFVLNLSPDRTPLPPQV